MDVGSKLGLILKRKRTNTPGRMYGELQWYPWASSPGVETPSEIDLYYEDLFGNPCNGYYLPIGLATRKIPEVVHRESRHAACGLSNMVDKNSAFEAVARIQQFQANLGV